jgi:hypothetical protein
MQSDLPRQGGIPLEKFRSRNVTGIESAIESEQ